MKVINTITKIKNSSKIPSIWINNEITDKLQMKITFLHFMQIIFCIISTGTHQKENLDFNFF